MKFSMGLGFVFLGLGLFSAQLGQAKVSSNPVHTKLPEISDLKSDKNDSSVSVSCLGAAPFSSIKCRITLTQISKPAPQGINSQIDKIKAFIESMDQAKFKKERKFYCQRYQTEKKTRKEREIASISPYQQALLKLLKRACASPQKDDLKMTMLEEKRLKGSVCSSTTQSYELTFQKEGESTFIAKPSPQGPCNLVTVSVLEREVTHTNLWKLSITHVSSLQDGQLCEGIQLHETQTYSSKNDPEISVDCQYVRFGNY